MKVRVMNYDAQWSKNFRAEAKKIRDILGDELVDIHHFGSTAVPGIRAKPIIDIMPLVKEIKRVDSFNDQMIALGYEPLGEYGIKGRRYFRKGEDNRTHQMHMFQFDNAQEIDRHLAVRDYLRKHPEAARAYGDLKAKLALRHPEDIEAYMNGKDAFVKELEKKALDWYNKDI
ncbi:GrpB-like predicted nucleotidyltransferase (UPF0157 family) [Virgibacillus halotolerans]|uniref:GrpB family protein n=1 Tax=Virgibacillus halotolerans TaxID=1071053 RepID=UPI001960F2F3|nr:GrpB family protein [Virgibacillus halotolerans]MBM7599586.1 GrpB-like predicted nucleotidyltransferase (UPF0157 family) [Virgibacillus halotolerans]